ncbi:hypothetical protein [Burkholderia vietnamiensis]|uniref:hypothetical protein n=1 Tax=Burkholderia vietnamiensis TaxID=60552 RepID=UPI0012D9E4F5|nr:hypothetical protein [Burkholderia vietnamiensis]MBR8002138.1 hypothetical protein [Burkholderia vietnamiensis]MCA7948569.1 hypothetical protein [Burkholderia vietnamiensis]HDR9222408.1 hypothetical protein [Burkholderia vietnamiensis]
MMQLLWGEQNRSTHGSLASRVTFITSPPTPGAANFAGAQAAATFVGPRIAVTLNGIFFL